MYSIRNFTSNLCHKKQYSPNYICKLPLDILNTIFDYLDFSSLNNTNLSSKKINETLKLNKNYTHLKISQKFAKKIVLEFKPKIKIVKFCEDYSIIAADSLIAETEKAKNLCEGLLIVDLNKEMSVSITYKAGAIEIPRKKIKACKHSDNSYYKCRFTNRVKFSFNDQMIGKAVQIAHEEINTLLEANSIQARNLRV
jgi:hypothetical protein